MTLQFYFVTLFLVACVALSQQNDIQLSIKIEGVDYSFRFNPSTTAAADLAKKFCYENGGRFGITVETVDNCIIPVANRLQAEVNAASQKAATTTPAQAATPAGATEVEALQVKFNIGGTDYQVRFQPTAVSTTSVATQFCQQKGGEFGITQETLPECVNGVNNHLLKEVEAFVQKKQAAAQAAKEASSRTVTVDLTIGSKEFHLSFQPTVTPPITVATQLCTEQGASFGVTADTLNSCINTITDYLIKEVNKSN